MKKLMLALLLTVALAFVITPAYGVTWTYHDFGSAWTDYTDINDNASPLVAYPYGIGYLPSPGNGGEGGEIYDLEGLNFSYDNAYLYVAVTASFGSGVWSSTFQRTFAEGDLFFGFDDGSKYDYAIDVSNNMLYDVNGFWNYIPPNPPVPGGYGNDPIIKAQIGAFDLDLSTAGAVALGGIDETYTPYAQLETNPMFAYQTNTWIKEYRISRSLLGMDDLMSHGSITFHTTMECGNDLIEKTFPVVPEPGTMILLGVGLLGLGASLRRRK